MGTGLNTIVTKGIYPKNVKGILRVELNKGYIGKGHICRVQYYWIYILMTIF